MILQTFLTAASLFGGPTTAPVQSDTSVATAEGIETLRRILADALDQTFTRDRTREKSRSRDGDREESRPGALFPGFAERGNLVTTLWSSGQTVQHSRAFHLPDAGLFLTLDAALPVTAKEKDTESPQAEGKTKDDEWEQALRRVRGGGTRPDIVFQHAGPPRETEIDPQAIERTIETVIKTVARYASRIEGLAPQETITVALHLSGRNRGVWNFDESTPEVGDAGELEDSTDEGSVRHSLTYVLMATDESRDQNLVIRLSLGDLANYSEGGYERLRQRVMVNRYQTQ